jgi:caffeoyl-CoA O-methyltransferase
MSDSTSDRKDWTLGRMYFQLDERAESYVLSRSSGYSSAARALALETEALGDPAVMMLGKEQFALFRMLCALLRCRRALDVGTFTGLSALAFAEGMGRQGQVTTIDRDPQWSSLAHRHWSAAGVAARIDARIGEADAVMRELMREGTRFDIVFIDVDKARVHEYVELAFDMLSAQGLVMVDNTLWHGWVMDSTRNDADTTGMRAFNDAIAADPRIESALLPIADGLTLLRTRIPTASD